MSKENSLLLPSSSIFENSNLVDCIRQSCIDLEYRLKLKKSNDNQTKKDIDAFLQQILFFLDGNIQPNLLEELVSIVSLCFEQYSEYSIPFLEQFLKKSRQNSNFIIVFASLLCGCVDSQFQNLIKEIQAFVKDSLKEILPQIKKSSEIWIIFHHQIIPRFQNDLLINLLLCSEMTKELFLDFIPFVLSKNLFLSPIYSSSQKYEFLLSKFGEIIQFMIPTKESNLEIQSLLSSKDPKLILNMQPESIFLISGASLFALRKGAKFHGLDEHSIIQFYSLFVFILQEINNSIPFDLMKDLLIKGIESLKISDSDSLRESINIIIKLCFSEDDEENIHNIDFSPCSFDVSFALIKKFVNNEFIPDLKSIYECMFRLTNYTDVGYVCKFLCQNHIFDFIFEHTSDIRRYCVFSSYKVNLSIVLQEQLIKFICKQESSDHLIEFISFIENFCYDVPELEVDLKLNEKLYYFYTKLIEENDLKRILVISSFIYNYYTSLFTPIEMSLPKQIRYILNSEDCQFVTAYEIIEAILISDRLDEDHNFLFDNLFNQMMNDDEIRKQYFDFLVTIDSQEEIKIDDFMYRVAIMLDTYHDDLIRATNDHFYFNENKGILLRKLNYSLVSKTVPKLGSDIVTILFEAIEKNPGKYQAFFCLKNIACAFPFLFTENSQKIFEIVLPSFNFISLMYSNEVIENKLDLIKSALCAVSFLFSTFQAPFLLDKFMKWLLPSLLKFTDEQVACFMIILNSLYNDGLFHCVIPAYIKKFNVMESAGILLKREIKNETFRIFYRHSIYSFLNSAYIELAKLKHYEIIQIDNFTRMESPFNYMFDYIYLTSPFVLLLKINKCIDATRIIPPVIDEFLSNLSSHNFFYLYLSVLEDPGEPDQDQKKDFIAHLEKTDLSEIDAKSFPIKIGNFTIKMIDYIVMQRGFIYCWFLYNLTTTLVPPLYDKLFEAAKEMLRMQQDANEHPDDKLNANITTYDIEVFLDSCYSQQKLYDSLLNNIFQSTVLWKDISNLFAQICLKRTGLSFLLKSLSKLLDENASVRLSDKKFHSIIIILSNISNYDGFEELFLKYCCDSFLNFILSPEIRHNRLIMDFSASLFAKFETLPIRVNQLIEYLFIIETENYNQLMELCSKLENNRLINVYNMILDDFDILIKTEPIQHRFFDIIQFIKPITDERREKMINLLKSLVSNSLLENTRMHNNVLILFDSIISSFKLSSDDFISFYKEYESVINKIIQSNPLLLCYCKFFLDNPEFINFKWRSAYFRETQKGKIYEFETVNLNIDRENILASSFVIFQYIENKYLYNTIHVEFIDEIVQDLGGGRREWFELLIKEIFNPSNHLFVCSEKRHSYQPNPNSSLHPNHLNYFQFCGKVIARALIEGISINAHLTQSFYKQILHQEPSLEDLDDIDEELYKGFEWMLHNDVEPLEKVFAIEIFDEVTKEHKIIPLKENGDRIKVDNSNKYEYVKLHSNFIFKTQIQSQLDAFCEGFNMLIPHKDIKFFTPNEFDLLFCGVPTIDVNDFKANCVFTFPYTEKSPVVELFFKVISKWENEDLAKLFKFMTGSSRVPANGISEFCRITKSPLRIESGGDRSLWPQSHTCFNILHLPQYETEEEMNEKLLQAIQFCETFGFE